MNNYGFSPIRKASIKGLWMFVLILFFGFQAGAQVSAYTFAQSSGTYTPITGGTTLGIPTNDDDNFNSLPIGFYFFYNGIPYNTFSVNNNGVVYMGNTATSTYGVIASNLYTNAIAGCNYDIQGNIGTGNLSYKTIGTAPNRTLVVQWTSYRAYFSTNGDNFNFQIRLNETSNTVQVVFGSYVINNLRGAQSGLVGGVPSDFNHREVINSISTWATSTAGAVNTATCELNSTLVPASGQTYTWTPAAGPVAPGSLTFTAVTTNSMTLNWVDNSTDEVNFYVFRSTDNINFTLSATVASSSTATTATPYTSNQTGLSNNTLYYWRVYASNTVHTTMVSGTQATLPGTLCGTISIGPTGTYTSLTAAVAAVQTNGISCPVIFELQAAYVSTVETFPIALTNLGTSSVNTITCRPELGATNLSITGAAAQTIDMSGTMYWTFDGRPGGVGTVSQLTLANTSTTGIAVRLTNDAQYNTLNYIKVRGVTTSVTTGAIVFGNAVNTGTSFNTIMNCDLTSGATNEAVLIYASNTSTTVRNTANVITNNVFYNWLGAAVADAAISITGSSEGWTISNNSFYQTASRTYTSGVIHNCININTSTGQLSGNFIVSGNFIGGTAASCGGSAWTDLGAVAHRFIAINVTTGAYGPNSIQGNTIRNFNFTTTSGTTTANGNWCAINMTGTTAHMNVGTITPNVIGSNTVNGQIVTSTSTSGGLTTGINSSTSGTIYIVNNQIGGITANSSSATISSSIFGITISSGYPTITGNIIGSTTLTNSLINAASTSATGGQITGINSAAFSAYNVFSNNTIANLTNQYAGTSTSGQVRGIITTSGSNQINGNTIAALATLSPQTGTTTTASVIGIGLQSTATTVPGSQKVYGNTIGGLANGTIAGNVQVNGILVNSATTSGYWYEVYGNSIQALGAPLTAGTSLTAGIQIYGGIGRVYNNMVILGLDVLGNAVTQNKEYDGILKNTTNNGTIMFNSVSIAGAGVAAGTNNTYAFRRASGPTSAPIDSVYSNVFSNTRSNGAGTGTHYAIQVAASTGMNSNGNNFYGNGTGYMMGAVGATPYATVAAWTTATTFDANSYGVNPSFASSTNLHINNPLQTPLESRAIPMNLNFDFDNQVRPGPTAVNGGGTGPDIGADEFDGFPVNIDVGIQVLVSPATSGCHSATDSIRVRLKNYATTTLDLTINNVIINANVTGPNPQSFGPVTVNTGTIAAGGTRDITIAYNYNMTAVGTYVFNANATQVNDFVNSNDAMGSVTIVIAAGTVTVAPNPQCSGSPVTLTLTGQTNGGSIQWQSSPDNIVWTNIPGATTTPYTVNPTDTTFYRTISCGLHNALSDTILTISVTPATTTNDTICGFGTVNLAASGNGTLYWYTTSTGGTSINTGTTYAPTISGTTTYYVENTFNSPGSGSLVPATCMPVYSNACTSNDFINNFSTTGGLTNISNLNSGCNGAGPNNLTFFPSQILTSTPGGTFNLSAQAGTAFSQGFRLWIDYNNDGDFSDAGEDVWASATANTTINTGTVVIPSNTTSGPKRMRLMCRYINVPATTDYCLSTATFGEVEEYTLMVGVLCSAVRTPVTGVVTPPPAVTLTAGSTSLCGSDSTMIVASSANSGYSYVWTPATYLNSSTNDSVMFVPPTPGTYSYVVTASDAVSGCTFIDTINLASSLRPTFTLNASNDTICGNSQITLNVVPPTSVVQLTNSNILNTTTTYPAPYGNWYGGARHQMLILASEMTAAGLSAGYIAGMQFQITNIGTSVPLQNFTIEMMQTNVTSITTFQTGSFITVLNDPLYAPFVGTNTHNFTTNFYWDGSSNIIIQTCFNNLSFTQNCVFRQAVTPFSSTVYYRNDNEPGVCTNNTVTASIAQRPNIAFLRSNASWAYSWTPAASLSAPTSDTTFASPSATGYYHMTVTDTITGCTKADSILIHVLPTPAPNLGPDTIICSNQPLLLDGTSGPYAYMWQDSLTTSQTFSANVFGLYDVFVTDTVNGCTGTDTVLIGVNAAPAFSLGSDVTVCTGTQVTFSGPGGQYDYLWSTADTTITITTGTGGNYELMVTDTVSGCYESDTIALNVNPLPAVALGADSTICSVNAPVVLAGPSGNYTYMWSDASTNPTLSVNATGTYYVTVTDTATTCFSGDTIMVTINSTPVVSIGGDSTQCGGSIMITAPAGPFDYLWNDNTTNGSLTATATGVYSVIVTDSVTGCAAADSVTLTINAVPLVDLGTDTTFCGGSTTLDAGVTTNGAYLWNNNSTNQTLLVTASGQYYVQVTDSLTGCGASDSVNLAISPPINVTFNITQTTICTTDAPLTLSGSPAGGVFTGPGVSGTTFNPATAGVGTHSITYDYTDANGCQGTASDVITVSACVGVDEPFVMAGMSVFPNPNNGAFTLTIKDADYTELTIEIASVDGKIIYSDKASNVQGNYVKPLDLSTHANGIYFLRLTANGQTFMQKIVKND